jgi:D-glucosaminate-6-phosphate ammonia-lyase
MKVGASQKNPRDQKLNRGIDMGNYSGSNVYSRIGVDPVINAGGNTTTWGGGTPSQVVKQAMAEADMSFVEMRQLLEKSGEHIAAILGAEAAYVTAGCYAALTLSAAACITGADAEKRLQIPNASGIKNEILIQKNQRYGFERCFTLSGGRLVEVGDENGTTPGQLEAAIGPNTAAVVDFVQPDWNQTVVPLEDVVRIAHERDVPVIADAASRIYPLDYFRQTAQAADLVCFGGKYLNAPQSTGFVCGRRDLVEAVTAHGFVSPRPFGRAMKVDRQEIIGLVVGLEEWFSMDHEARFREYDIKFDAIKHGLQGVASVRKAEVVRTTRHPGVTLHVVIDSETLGKQARDVMDELQKGKPGIRMLVAGQDMLNINVHTLKDGEEQIVAQRLRQVLEKREA